MKKLKKDKKILEAMCHNIAVQTNLVYNIDLFGYKELMMPMICDSLKFSSDILDMMGYTEVEIKKQLQISLDNLTMEQVAGAAKAYYNTINLLKAS